MKPYVLGAIFARGGSKGVPGKNIRALAGKPLIAYAIEAGSGVSLIDRLIVSTDDEEIAALARKYGAEVPFVRPAALAADDSPELLSWQHALKAIQEQSGQMIDVLVSIPTTSPLRSVEDVERCLLTLLEGDADIVVTVKEAERNPYFNMLTVAENGDAKLLMPSPRALTHRQNVPAVYDMTTVAYAARTSYILNASSLLEGKVKAIVVPQERALDIDSMIDFEMAEFLLAKRGKNNEVFARTGKSER